jgi:hypothetical protein
MAATEGVMPELSQQVTLVLLGVSSGLVLLLVVAMLMRPRVFTQYLAHMTGIKLSARDVATVYKTRGKAGVRDMFLELIIREDLRDGPRITPDTPPDRELLAPEEVK